MTNTIEIADVRLRMRSPGAPGPLLGWASCVVNSNIKLDSIEIHRKRDGTLYIWCPSVGSRRGVSHRYFFPITPEARRALETAVLRQVSREAGAR